MKNIRIGIKIALGFGLVITALIVVGLVGFLKSSTIQDQVGDLSGTHIPLSDVITTIDSAATGQELAVTKYALHQEEGFLKEYRELDKKVDDAIGKARQLITGDQELVEKGWLVTLDKIAKGHDIRRFQPFSRPPGRGESEATFRSHTGPGPPL